MSYEIIKEYYQKSLFNAADLDLFVACGWINEQQKKEILN